MTIEGNWISMREHWSGLGTTDPDGVKTWDTSLLELGLTGANITCTRQPPGNIYDFVVVAPSDWYVSQRADWFETSELSSTTLRITVTIDGLVEIGGMTTSGRKRLVRGLYVYCKRQSDNAIAVFDCEGVGLNGLATSTSMTG